MNNVNEIFSEIENWEIAPINEILHHCDGRLDGAVKRVVVYGPTQVGKTTLILDLIGIKSELQKELGELLRGESKAGTSSTSCAIIYNQWDKEQFGLLFGDFERTTEEVPECYNKDDFQKAIAEINSKNRDNTESKSRATQSGTVLYYYIPRSYFDDDAPDNLQIVDLPGFGERNQKMSKKVDQMVNALSRHVAGAILVVKSENIVKLGSEYKPYLNMHSQNRLAIAVKYALATSNQIKNSIFTCGEDSFFNDCATEREKAEKLSDYYQNLIDSEGYVAFSKDNAERMVFPMEHSGWLAENYPALAAVFSESRKMLRERVYSMENQTSIDACMDELTRRKNYLEKYGKTLDQEFSEIQEWLHSVRKTKKSLIESEKRGKADLDEKSANVSDLNAEAEIIRNRIVALSQKQLITSKNAVEIWQDRQNGTVEKTAYSWVSERIVGWLGEEPRWSAKIFRKICATIEAYLGQVDFGTGFKKIDGFIIKKFGEKSITNSTEFGRSLLLEVQRLARDVFEKEMDALLQAANMDLRQADDRYKKAQRALLDITITETDAIQQQDRYIELIEINQEEILNASKNYDAVTAIFIKHYHAKVAEIKDRIERESSAEKKTALLLALSAIHLAMRPYLKEDLK